jgi:hypothetical protein
VAAQPPKSLADLLERGGLAKLTAEARRRRALTEEIRGLLPPEAADHLVSAGTAPTGEIVLTMDTSVWAARVRYHTEQLDGGRRVKVRVRPPK